MPWGVGVIGAGPGVAALHLPTLERLQDRFTVVHVADHGSGRAEELAGRLGAAASTGTEALLADPAVEVLAICSPPGEHARQIREGIAAGVRAILCEKPLATTTAEAREVVDACREAGVMLLVATNHFYDEAWDRAKHHLVALQSDVRTISATVALPPNGRYHAAVTELGPGGRATGAGHPTSPIPTSPRRSSASSCSGSRCTTSRPCATWRPTSRASTSPRPLRRSATRSASVPAGCACC